MKKSEYLSRIIKPIPFDKFKVYDFRKYEGDVGMIVDAGINPIEQWFRLAWYENQGVKILFYVQEIDDIKHMIILTEGVVFEGRRLPPLLFIIFPPNGSAAEIPDKVVEKSLNALTPKKFPFWILLFTPLLLIPFLLEDLKPKFK